MPIGVMQQDYCSNELQLIYVYLNHCCMGNSTLTKSKFVNVFNFQLRFIYPTVFLSNQFLSHDKLLKYYIKSYKQRVELYPMVLELVSQQMGRIQNSTDKQLLQTVIEKVRMWTSRNKYVYFAHTFL